MLHESGGKGRAKRDWIPSPSMYHAYSDRL
jgi:hypothetical protein